VLSKENKNLRSAINRGLAPHQIESIERAYTDGHQSSSANIMSMLVGVKEMISTIDESNSATRSKLASGKAFKLGLETP